MMYPSITLEDNLKTKSCPPHLVQGEHGEHWTIVGFDRFQQHGFLPNVNVSSGGAGEHQRIAATVTHRHHGLWTSNAPERTTLECQATTCRTEKEVYETSSLLPQT